MKLLGKLFQSCFDAGIFLLERLGAQGPRWEWKKTRWRMSLEARLAAWEMTERGIRAPVRMCPECRELVSRQLSTCSACGASMRGVTGGGAGRLLSAILPKFSSLTSVLITFNVVMLAVPLLLWGVATEGGGLFHFLAPPGEALFAFGSKFRAAIFAGQAWRLVTAGFLHGGLIHLGFNCYALSILGPLIENSFGWRKFLFLYVVTSVAAFAASAAYSQYQSVGASGAIFGLLGFGVVFGRYRAGPSGRAISDQLLRWVFLAVLMLFMPGIDNAAHFGGFVAGALLAFKIDPGEARTPKSRALWTVVTWAVGGLLLASFLAMLVSYPANVAWVTGQG